MQLRRLSRTVSGQHTQTVRTWLHNVHTNTHTHTHTHTSIILSLVLSFSCIHTCMLHSHVVSFTAAGIEGPALEVPSHTLGSDLLKLPLWVCQPDPRDHAQDRSVCVSVCLCVCVSVCLCVCVSVSVCLCPSSPSSPSFPSHTRTQGGGC